MTVPPVSKVPADQPVEMSLIGSVLVLPELLDELAQRVSTDDFFALSSREVWKGLLSLQGRAEPIDEHTLRLELKSMGIEGRPTDEVFLWECRSTAAEEPAAALKYADRIREYAVRRRILQAGVTLAESAADLKAPVDSTLAKHAHALEQLPGMARSSKTLAQAYGTVFEEYGHPVPGQWTTGLAALDAKLTDGGMKPGQLIIPAGRPSMGKSAFMHYMAHCLVSRNIPVGIVSLEMSEDEVMDRFTRLETRIPQGRLRSTLTTAEQTALGAAHTKFTVTTYGNIMHLLDDVDLTVERLRALCGVWARQGVKVVFVDYIQLLNSGGLFKPSERTAEVGYFSRSLKKIARANRIAVVAASQLSREVEKRADKKPIMSDLRESGTLEQDADLIMFLNRRGIYDESIDKRVLDVDLAKQRNGEIGMVNAWLELESGRVLPARVPSRIDLSNL